MEAAVPNNSNAPVTILDERNTHISPSNHTIQYPPIVVSATSTTTTTLMDKSSNNDDDVETQAVQAANQLIANYIKTENYLMEDIPDLFETVEPLTSPTSSTSLSPTPELLSLPPPPPPTPSSPEPPIENLHP